MGPAARTASPSRRGAPAAVTMAAGATLLLFLLGSSFTVASAFLSPLPSSSPLGPVVGGRRGAAAVPRHHTPAALQQQPRWQQQRQRLFMSLDTQEKKEEAKALVVVDPAAQQKFQDLLEDGTDLLGLVDHLKAHRGRVQLTWDQAATLLDKMADSKTFRANMLERQEKGLIPATERETRMEDFMNQPARAFMALEEWQKLQLEGVVFCYDLLKEQGLLKGFACIQETRAYTESFLPKNVDADVIEKRSELPMTALTPGQGQNLWAYSGVLLCLLELAICKFYGVDAGAVIPATILAFFFDRFLLGGQIFDQFARVFFPKYKERIVRHEAGHFLVAYLLGCPVQNCILKPVFNGAVFGEAGTIFLDKKLFEELEKARISASSVDRYTSVVMGGIASEAITFQNAQGGASDEQSILLLLSLMNWDFARITSQARWAALRAVLILKDYSDVYEALVAALLQGQSVGQCIKTIEEAIAASDKPLVPPAALPPPPPPAAAAPSPFDALQRVMMPSPIGGSGPTTPTTPLGQRLDESSGDRALQEMMRRAAERNLENVTPSFEKGPDAIARVEEKERRAAEEADRRLKQKMREVNLRLKRVSAQLDGKPAEEAEEEAEEALVEETGQEEAQIDAELRKLDERLRELNAQLGGGMGGPGRRFGAGKNRPPPPPSSSSSSS